MPSVVEARIQFTELLARAHYKNERTVITRHNTPFAAIVSIEEMEQLERLDAIRHQHGLSSIAELIDALEPMFAAVEAQVTR